MFFLVSTGGGPLDTERLRFHNAVSGSAELLAGKFEVPGVRPGDYDMYVLLDNEDDALPDVDYLAAHQRITVGSSGLQSVSVGIGAAASRITGRLVLVDGAKLDPKSKLDVFAQPMAAVYPDIKGLTRGATVNPDGAFEISGLLDHHYLVTLSGLPPGVAVADIRQGGRSALDDGIAAGGGSEPMEIVVTGSAGTVRVNARDANGQPVKNATVTLVPTGDRSRYFTERTRSGHSQIEGVLPGEYVLFAWDDIPDGAELNADFMREYEAHGVRILVEPRQSIAVDVPLVSTEDTVWLSGAAGCSETQ
jgi:hypothetical protein